MGSGVVDAHRRRLLRQARGAVLDLSLRPDANFPVWPKGLDSLTVGVSPGEDAGGYFGSRPGQYDTIVSVFTACTIDRVGLWLNQISASLAPRGQLLLLEHVKANGTSRFLQRSVNPVARYSVGGCRLDMDVTSEMRAAGFGLRDGARWRVPGPVPLPYSPGVALAAAPLVPAKDPKGARQ